MGCLVSLYSVIISQAAACHDTAPLDFVTLLHQAQTRNNCVNSRQGQEWTLTDGYSAHPPHPRLSLLFC